MCILFPVALHFCKAKLAIYLVYILLISLFFQLKFKTLRQFVKVINGAFIIFFLALEVLSHKGHFG